jgi:hypothetical protein
MRYITPICILLLLLVAVSPAMAITTFDKLDAILNAKIEKVSGVKEFTYDSSQIGHAIYRAKFSVPSNSYVNFTLYYGTDKSVVGSAQTTTAWGLTGPVTTSTVTLDGTSKSYTFWDTQPQYDYNIAGYGTDANGTIKGFAVYSEGYGSWDNDLAVAYTVTNPVANLIYKIHFSSPKLFDIEYTTAPFNNIAQRIGTTQGNIVNEVLEVVAFATRMFSKVMSMLSSLAYWLDFFFIKNLGLLIAGYFMLSMAFAAKSSRGNPAKFFRRLISDVKALVTFIIELYRIMVEILQSIRKIFLG